MFTRDIADTVSYVEKRAQDFAKGCKNVYVAVSGGVDSAVVVTLLARAFGAKRVVGLYRDVCSNPAHHADVIALQKAVGFHLFSIDANRMYDDFLAQCRAQFIAEGMLWYEEGSEAAEQNNWDSGYASLKSRLNTPMAGFVAKVIDNGGGRVFGTGNMEEDYLLRYFDKGGDGVVDNNLLMGLLKMEVRQMALFFAREYDAEIFAKIAHKIPSADLHANGDAHNDESELTALARKKGYNITLSYGTAEEEGNIAWIAKQDCDYGVITGNRRGYTPAQLRERLGYTQAQIDLTLFVREVEQKTRHKKLTVPGVSRTELRARNLVD